MPKILVVFYSGDAVAGAIADAVAAGAESVRFSEVDVRGVGDAPLHVSASKPRRQLDSAGELAAYDAIIVGAAVGDGGLPAPVAALLDAAAESAGSSGFADKVGSAFTSTTTGAGELAAGPVVARLASLGMILVPPVASGGTAAQLERARAMGRRVAQVTAWVVHSLGHEHGHDDAPPKVHDHGHPHGQAHPHGHSHDH